MKEIINDSVKIGMDMEEREILEHKECPEGYIMTDVDLKELVEKILTSAETEESLDAIKVTHCKVNWNELSAKAKEFAKAGVCNGTVQLDKVVVKKEYTVLDVLELVLDYLGN